MIDPFAGDPFVGPLAHAIGAAALFPVFFIILTLWTVFWKSLALWHAARSHQRIWFIVLVIVNTAGILEIIYLKWFKKDENGDGTLFPFLKEWKEQHAQKASAPKEEPKA